LARLQRGGWRVLFDRFIRLRMFGGLAGAIFFFLSWVSCQIDFDCRSVGARLAAAGEIR